MTLGNIVYRAVLVVTLAFSLAPKSIFAHTDKDIRKCQMFKSGEGEIVAFETYIPDGRTATIYGMFVKPDNPGPYPAIILLHRVFGVERPECFSTAISRYRASGYAVLLVDSDSATSKVRTSTSGQTTSGYSFIDQAADSFGAIAYLISRPDIQHSNIFLVGHAYGGSAALRAISEDAMRARLAGRYAELRSFLSGVIAWHPSCPDMLLSVGVPLLMISGTKDKMNSTHACKVMAIDLLPDTADPVHKVFSGAGHNFDMEWFTEYDSNTTNLAYEEIADFLSRRRKN